ncbi:MAG: LacI family DNA-binding transcriptional regulator [Lachnospiraceae bacterium]|nr:LacI family DNA-binding transcriptional regulator [Lachnospiraceae bacterium]
MVTIKDIAAATGVSPTTVSNVINGKAGRVSAQTIESINKAIKELGYVPNMSAKSLVSRSSKVIGFVNHVVTYKHSNFMEDPFLSRFVGIIERVLREQGYFLMLRTVETPEEFQAFLQNWNLDGLFLAGIFKDDFFSAISEAAKKRNIPIVLVDSYVHDSGICNVGLDDFGGSKQSTKYLIDKGHKKIAYCTLNIKDGGVLMERFLGYKAALTESGITFDESLVIECGMTLEHTKKAAEVLAADPDITGIVTTADLMAANLISNLRALGVNVPEDKSVMGYDDLNICTLTYPQLTTVHQDMDLKGRTAVDFMLELLQHKIPNPNEVYLPTEIIERDSVKALN